jgi:ATP-GRASP peptide maturase of grasp-with-spasm system
MILLLSQEATEQTTEEVIDWITALGGRCARLNGEDLDGDAPFHLSFGGDGCAAAFRLDGSELSLADVRVVWLRRWHQFARYETPLAGPVPGPENRVRGHMIREIMAVTGGVSTLLDGADWLTRPEDAQLSKLAALRAAARAGLVVPATLVTNHRADLLRFMDAHPRVVTKCVSDAERFTWQGRKWGLYTAEVSREEAEAAPELFFPSLFQVAVDKAYELRVFYLDGRCWPMAIFSQADAQTRVDVRVYNHARPNRTVPARLPDAVQAAIVRFMEAMELKTGSLDLIRTHDGRHVFLEVNPGGQFGMVSEPCNYYLEREVAQYLLRKDRGERD